MNDNIEKGRPSQFFLLGEDTAEQVATWTKYEWHRDLGWDPFAKVYGLI